MWCDSCRRTRFSLVRRHPPSQIRTGRRNLLILATLCFLAPFAWSQGCFAFSNWASVHGRSVPTSVSRATSVDGVCAKAYALSVVAEGEAMQQPVRKIVGKPATQRQRLACVEELAAFVNKYAPGAIKRTEGDYFPVRKVVGRPRARGG